MGLFDVHHGLDDHQVHASLDQSFDLLAKRLAGFFARGGAERLQAQPQRADGSGHPEVIAGHFPRQARSGEIDLADFIPQIEFGQAQPCGSKGIRLEHFGARLDIAQMDFFHQVRRGKVQFVETAAEGDTL